MQLPVNRGKSALATVPRAWRRSSAGRNPPWTYTCSDPWRPARRPVVAIGGPKPRALLAMLALDAGSTVSAERLIDGLWGDEPPPTAAKMVQLYVSQLRKAMAAHGERDAIVDARARLRAAARPRPGGRRALRAAARPGRARARRCACGAGRRWPTSPTSRSPLRRSGAWRSCARARSRSRSTRISTPGATARCCRSSRRCWRRSRCASACTRSACSRSTARAARPRRWRRTARRARRWSSRSASSPAPSCGGCTRRSCVRTPRSTRRGRSRPAPPLVGPRRRARAPARSLAPGSRRLGHERARHGTAGDRQDAARAGARRGGAPRRRRGRLRSAPSCTRRRP